MAVEAMMSRVRACARARACVCAGDVTQTVDFPARRFVNSVRLGGGGGGGAALVEAALSARGETVPCPPPAAIHRKHRHVWLRDTDG